MGGDRPTAESIALKELLQLCDAARQDKALLLPSSNFQLPAPPDEAAQQFHAFVVGPVVRQIVSQGELFVCGAASTAGALNACTEKLPRRRQLKLSWEDVLFGHFQDKLGIKIRDSRRGDPASWRVGKAHIKTVIESFPGMHCKDLISLTEASPVNREAAWVSLVAALRKPNTAVFYHAQGASGHYTLVAGAVGPMTLSPSSPGKEVVMPYDEEHSAILTNEVYQEPRQRVTFKKVCDSIVNRKGFFRILLVEYKAR